MESRSGSLIDAAGSPVSGGVARPTHDPPPRGFAGRYRLTTLRRNGSPVERTARCRAQGGKLYVGVPAQSPTAERIWNEARVVIQACTRWGRPAGLPAEAAARILSQGEEAAAARALSGTGGFGVRLREHLPWRRTERLYVEIVPL